MTFKNKWRLLLMILISLVINNSSAQTITKLTITDNLAPKSKFGFGKPKPAEAKDHFAILPDKGTQVLFYADLDTLKSPALAYKLRFSAYLIHNGKDEWIDERDIEMNPAKSFALSAFNFFDEGNYKIVITSSADSTKMLSEGRFVVENQK